jgi:oligopeptide transport system ATP-binding protein
MGLILITHDLAIVAENCDRIAVMYAGKVVEIGSVKEVYNNPAHPYTMALMQALPKLDSKRKRLYQIEGEPPNLLHLPPGCSFWPRCPRAMDICKTEYPPLTLVNNDRSAACWLVKREANQ